MSAADDAEWLRWVTKQFGSIAGKDKEIDLEEFKTALQVKEVSAGTGSAPAAWHRAVGSEGKLNLKPELCEVGKEKPHSTLQQARVENTD